jgi:hypothetical protein
MNAGGHSRTKQVNALGFQYCELLAELSVFGMSKAPIPPSPEFGEDLVVQDPATDRQLILVSLSHRRWPILNDMNAVPRQLPVCAADKIMNPKIPLPSDRQQAAVRRNRGVPDALLRFRAALQ